MVSRWRQWRTLRSMRGNKTVLTSWWSGTRTAMLIKTKNNFYITLICTDILLDYSISICKRILVVKMKCNAYQWGFIWHRYTTRLRARSWHHDTTRHWYFHLLWFHRSSGLKERELQVSEEAGFQLLILNIHKTAISKKCNNYKAQTYRFRCS